MNSICAVEVMEVLQSDFTVKGVSCPVKILPFSTGPDVSREARNYIRVSHVMS